MEELTLRALRGEEIGRAEALSLVDAPLDALCRAAEEIRARRCGDALELCAIVSGKMGRCSEDCQYCAQSARCEAAVEEYPLLDAQALLAAAREAERRGALRFSIVTSGARLGAEEVAALCDAFRLIRLNTGLSLCASCGLLGPAQFARLAAAGVTRYHNNLETSRRFFPRICTTHGYEDKLRAIRDAQAAGLEVCSGGILGLGESWEDRVDWALDLRGLGVRSVPVNALNPIPGTPLAGRPPLAEAELCRALAIFRFLLPRAALRLAGGRALYPDRGLSALRSGANAAITGDMLTTAGVDANEDLDMAAQLGREVRRV